MRRLSSFSRIGSLGSFTKPAFFRPVVSLSFGHRTFASSADKTEVIPVRNQVNDNLEVILDEFSKAGISRSNLTISAWNDLRAKNPTVQSAYQRLLQLTDQYWQEGHLGASAKQPVRVSVTGAAGAIGYQLLYRIASGQMLGADQPIILQCLELTPALKALEGVAMELQDCAFPLLRGIVQTDDLAKGFEGADYVLLVGAKPRGKGMERADLLRDNAKIFAEQGKALNKYANREEVKIVVVGNPANTNAWVAHQHAPDIRPQQFSAMTRLDHNRGIGLLSEKTGVPVNKITRFAIWGNHSKTQYPDISHTQIDGSWASKTLDSAWVKNEFIPRVQDRGAEIIKARGASSAASAASSAIDHMRSWELGSYGQWVSMGVFSDGSYGTEPGLYYSFPCVCEGGNYTIVQNIPIDKFSADMMEKTNKELFDERQQVISLLGLKPVFDKERYAKLKSARDSAKGGEDASLNKKLEQFFA
eukprot:TRINITY_DN4447_c0_g3_i2.p1 TRINITY_DN4447_c0_g3~~TRINITY_DN4447_c0_g3_i2.p1  ORF type:complete len:474 (-),score=72.67 TRINITY_DN4447_c0_g3_i2:40-1461(-)